jgi:hypothetical protein
MYTVYNDKQRIDDTERIRLMCWCITQIKHSYSDHTLAFAALDVVCDALEMAQCAVAREMDGGKLIPLMSSLRKIVNR